MKIKSIIIVVLSIGIIMGSATVVTANTAQPDRPSWVTVDGRMDMSKLPDDAKIPYTCWSGKTIALEGKVIKQREKNEALPGSVEHELGMAKMKELRQIPGVVTLDSKGGEVVTIDESNPKIQEVMKKYELKENPQCK